MQKFSILVIFILFNLYSFAGYIKGTVKDSNGESIPYASVYVKNSTFGVATDTRGQYFLELKPGIYTIVYSFVGCETFEKEVVINHNSALLINVVLKPSVNMVKEVVIQSDYKDWTSEVMKNVRNNRKFYLDKIESYKCRTYLKTSIEKESLKVEKTDSITKDTLKAKDMKEHLKKEKMNLIESISETNFANPSKYKEVILAHHDYAETKGEGGKSASISISYGEEDIIPETRFEDNPYILYNDVASVEFNFYKNLIDFPSITQKPILSPIAANSALSYKYKFVESFYENDRKIHKFHIEPIFKSEPLFSGEIYIEDSTWALTAVDLELDKAVILFCRDFKIIQNYEEIDTACFLPVRREISYTIKEGKSLIYGSTRVDHSNYEINIDFPDKFFNNEIKTFDVYAFDKDSVFWNAHRPITLKENELDFIEKTDSLKAYYTSEEYYTKIDSSFNAINWWFWLQGVGHRNRIKGTEWYISGLVEQINPLGIGGYRHKLPGYFQKEFNNNYLLETRGFVDYGFRNKDIKGKISVGLTYVPLKFVRTTITIGDFYEMINNNASFEQAFSRSNYARNKTFSIAQRMEIVNGLFGELTFDFSDQIPITNIDLSDWSTYLFGDLNNPETFERYTKSELRLDLKYRFNQKYIIKGNKKYIIGTEFPELRFIYRKGIPNLFNSEVDFDYIEFGAKDEMQMARFGSTSWDVQAGTFTNKNNLRLLEYKYFRGSDRIFFSDPVRSFQLLGTSLNTRNEFFRANFIHHFEGAILNKIPLFSRMHLSLAGGAGILMIKDQNFSHAEMFAGVEKIFRIKKQLFRFSVYAVTADNSLNKADFTIKFGLSFYNTYTNKWDY